MARWKQSVKRIHLLTVWLILPIVVFLYLRTFPDRDLRVWGLTWNTRLIHYYGVSFAAFMALITALFASAAIGARATARTLFITLGFASISALLLIAGVTTPGVIVPDTITDTFRWSLRLSLFAGALFFALSVTAWPEPVEKAIIRYRRTIFLVLILLFVLYMVIAFGFNAPLEYLTQVDPLLTLTLAAICTGFFLWAAILNYRRYRRENRRIDRQLALSLLLLAEAQLFMAFGVWGRLSWLMSHTLIIVALTVALYALLMSFQSTQQLRPSHYFGALGSIVIAGLSLIIGEVGMGFLQSDLSRSTVVTLALAQGGLSFLVLYVIVFYLDRLITERNEALEREQRLRNELTQLIVHDLKNPLSVITSGLNLLSRGQFQSSPETQKQLIRQLETSGQNVINLINDLLDLERLENGKLMLQKQPTDISMLLMERTNDYRILAQTHKQSLMLHIPAILSAQRVDVELMRRVMNNLLANALKFTPEEGQIQVSAMREEKDLLILVDDSGPGVPLQDRSRIFEKFEQVAGAERRGSGLGLTFCMMVVEAHEGTLTVTDSPLGGARFVIRLPWQPGIAGAPETAVTPPDALDSQQMASAS